MNPALFLATLNGTLATRDRAGVGALTGTGAVRYQPAEGARVNYSLNARAASDTTYWGTHAGGTVTRVEDSDFTYGTAFEYTSDGIGSGEGITATTHNRLYGYAGEITISWDAKLVSGAGDYRAHKLSRNAAGSLLGSDTNNAFTATPTVQRFSMTFTPEAGAHAVTPRFTRASAAASVIRISNIVVEQGGTDNGYFDDGVWLNPITGILGTPHASPSVERAVAWVEEGTTNLHVNPACSGTTHRFTGNANVTMTSVTTHASHPFCVGACKVERTGTEEGSGGGGNSAYASAAISLAAGQPLTGSVWLLGTASTDGEPFNTGLYLSGGANPAAFVATKGETISADGWTEYVISGTVDYSDRTNCSLYIQGAVPNSGDVIYMGAAQIENKSYATSVAAGNIGTGYAWTGTAHASTSTRTATNLNVAIAGIADEVIGAAAAKTYFETGRTSDSEILSLGGYLLTPSAGVAAGRLVQQRSSNRVFASWSLDGGSYSANLYSAASSSPLDTWSHSYTDWNGTATSIAVDDDALSTSTRGDPTGQTFPTYLYIGTHGLDSNYLNGYIGPVMIFDRPLTAGERAALLAAFDVGSSSGKLWSLIGGNRYNIFQLRPIGA